MEGSERPDRTKPHCAWSRAGGFFITPDLVKMSAESCRGENEKTKKQAIIERKWMSDKGGLS